MSEEDTRDPKETLRSFGYKVKQLENGKWSVRDAKCWAVVLPEAALKRFVETIENDWH